MGLGMGVGTILGGCGLGMGFRFNPPYGAIGGFTFGIGALRLAAGGLIN
jgi:hypothetical protein